MQMMVAEAAAAALGMTFVEGAKSENQGSENPTRVTRGGMNTGKIQKYDYIEKSRRNARWPGE